MDNGPLIVVSNCGHDGDHGLSHLSLPKPPRSFATSSVTSMKITRSGLWHWTEQQLLYDSWPGQPNVRLFAPVVTQPWFDSWECHTAVRIPVAIFKQWSNREINNLSMIMFVPAAKLLWICFSFSHLWEGYKVTDIYKVYIWSFDLFAEKSRWIALSLCSLLQFR